MRRILLAIASVEFLLAIALVVNAAYSGNHNDAVPDNSSSSTSPQTTTPPVPIQTTTPPVPIVETDKILGAICTTVPENSGAISYSGQPTEMYDCERNGSHISLQVDIPEELANFEERWPFVKLIKTQLLCGDGWKLNFQRPDYSAGDAGILYQLLSKAGIPSESCS